MLLGLPEFEMLFPRTVEETCALLSRYGDGAQLVAGGTDLLVKMKHRRSVPRCLINIKKIPGLGEIRYDAEEGLRIGALTLVQSIGDSALIGKKFPFLKDAAGVLGTTQIRNLGTIGGNLANASPSAEFAPPLLVLEASVRCLGRGGERVIPLREFFLAPGKSALRVDEVLTEVRVPNPPPGAQGVYLKHSLRRMDVAMASAAVLVVLEGDRFQDVRIALGAVAPTPFRAEKAEQSLRGKLLNADSAETELLEEAATTASGESLPIDDLRGNAPYRRRVVRMLVAQGLEQVVARSRAGRRPQ